jgi:hypothetical protein
MMILAGDTGILVIPGIKRNDITEYFVEHEFLSSQIQKVSVGKVYSCEMDTLDNPNVKTLPVNVRAGQVNVQYDNGIGTNLNVCTVEANLMHKELSDQELMHGDCGAPLIDNYLQNGKVHPFVRGILCSYQTKDMSKKFFLQLTRSLLNEIKRIASTVHASPCCFNLDAVEGLNTDVSDDPHNSFAYFKNGFRPKGRYLGKMPGNSNNRNKSDIVDTPDRSFWEERGYATDATGPPMGMWKAKQVALLKFWHTNISLPLHLLRLVNTWLVAYTIGCLKIAQTRMPGDPVFNLAPISNDQVMNGCAVAKDHPERPLPFLNPVNMSSSAGHPWNTSKDKVQFDGKPLGTRVDGPIEMPQELADRLDAIGERLNTQGTSGCIFTAIEKDEPISEAKVEAGKVRIIYTSPMDLTCFVRKIFGPLINMMQTFPHHFESWVGCNADSLDWTHVHECSLEHKFRFGCDHSGYDTKSVSQAILHLSYSAFAQILAAFGGDSVTAEKLGTDMISPVVNFFGWLYCFEGFNASGNVLTTHINSYANRLILRTCFLKHCLLRDGIDPTSFGDGPKDFEYVCKQMENISMGVYGDDNIMSTNDPTFTFRRLKELAAEHGVVLTDPLKTGEDFDFQTEEQISFLKRGFVKPEKYGIANTGMLFSPIELATISRMLCVRKLSSIDDSDYIKSRNQSALQLMFGRGPEEYEAFRRLLIENTAEYTSFDPSTIERDFMTFEEKFLACYGEQLRWLPSAGSQTTRLYSREGASVAGFQ